MKYIRQPLPPLPRRRNAPSWELEQWGTPGQVWEGDFLDFDPLDGIQRAADGGPVDYDTFRVGLNFADVAQLLDVEARNRFASTGERMFITRRTILGRLHQIKRETYASYLAEFDSAV